MREPLCPEEAMERPGGPLNHLPVPPAQVNHFMLDRRLFQRQRPWDRGRSRARHGPMAPRTDQGAPRRTVPASGEQGMEYTIIWNNVRNDSFAFPINNVSKIIFPRQGEHCICSGNGLAMSALYPEMRSGLSLLVKLTTHRFSWEIKSVDDLFGVHNNLTRFCFCPRALTSREEKSFCNFPCL